MLSSLLCLHLSSFHCMSSVLWLGFHDLLAMRVVTQLRHPSFTFKASAVYVKKLS